MTSKKPVSNTSITKPTPYIPNAVSVHVPSRASAAFWTLQAYGLLGITFLSFFPRLFHFQEYAFFLLLAVALCLAWVERVNPWIRTPIDLPLLGFVGWVLVRFLLQPIRPIVSRSGESLWRRFSYSTGLYSCYIVAGVSNFPGKLSGRWSWVVSCYQVMRS